MSGFAGRGGWMRMKVGIEKGGQRLYMDIRIEESPFNRWTRMENECKEVIYYCDGYICSDESKLYRPDYEIQEMHDKYGDPSPELRQRFKERLKEEYLKYWETI